MVKNGVNLFLATVIQTYVGLRNGFMTIEGKWSITECRRPSLNPMSGARGKKV